jgi:hypothetical protein
MLGCQGMALIFEDARSMEFLRWLSRTCSEDEVEEDAMFTFFSDSEGISDAVAMSFLCGQVVQVRFLQIMWLSKAVCTTFRCGISRRIRPARSGGAR